MPASEISESRAQGQGACLKGARWGSLERAQGNQGHHGDPGCLWSQEQREGEEGAKGQHNS